MSQSRELSDAEIAALFGTTPGRLQVLAGGLLGALDRRYTPYEGAERDALVLGIQKTIEAPDLKEAGKHRAADWERGWRQNLDEFVASGFNRRTLVPKYYKENVPVRLLDGYAMPAEPDFVYKFTDLFRAWLFQEYFAGADSVYEFGCGTGYNLVQLAGIYPNKPLFGFDWATSSQEILKVLADRVGLEIEGRHFDFFNPDQSIALRPGAAVLTFGALEQAGTKHGPYLDFVLARRPALCVDVIGVEELYDETTLVDSLAARYHRRRGYLSGYLTRLRELESAGCIDILKTHHQRFGNLHDDPHSYIVWKPK